MLAHYDGLHRALRHLRRRLDPHAAIPSTTRRDAVIVYLAIAAGAIGVSAVNRRRGGRHRPRAIVLEALRRPLVGSWNGLDLVVVAGLVVFSAFRFGIGTDYGLYTVLFERLTPWDWTGAIARSPQELGFTLLSLVFRSVSASPRPLFIACSLATVALSYAAFKRASSSMTLSVAVYVLFAGYLQPFNTVRQGLAIAILLFANRFLGRRWAAWAPLVVLAASFHTTALFAAVVQLVVLRWRPTPRTSLAVLLVVGVGGGLLIRLPLLGQWLSAINPRYGAYLLGSGSGVGTYLIAAVWAVLLFGSYLLLRGAAPSTDRSRWLAYGTMAVLFTVIGTFSPDAGRMADYFTPYFALLVPAVAAAHPRRQVIAAAVLVFGTCYFVVFLLSFGGLLPYAARLD